MIGRVLVVLTVLAALVLSGLYLLGSGVLGHHWGVAEVADRRIPVARIHQRAEAQRSAARAIGAASAPSSQILFGDLHVHSTYSTDAFLMSLPTAGGEGAQPVADACDFARFCSGLDFWSINDHALALTPRRWQETVDAMRQCNDVAGDAANPDVAVFLGWEWTQIGDTPEKHYGHKNVILRHLDDARIPTRPIAAPTPSGGGAPPNPFVLGLMAATRPSQTTLDVVRYFRELDEVETCPSGVPVRDLPDDCREVAETPRDLFAKLDDWGHEAMVIPHGTSWGYYTPQGSSWDKQLTRLQHDPARQRLIEVYSGHGNSEEFRDWREIRFGSDGTAICPEPTANFLPSCWRAGEIIRERCSEAGESASACDTRASEARAIYFGAGISGHRTVPGATAEDWLDSGQCRDCFHPAFNFRPRSSVQYIMALGETSANAARDPLRFRFGFIASSDNHSARPGTGYKEFARSTMTEARFDQVGVGLFPAPSVEEPAPRSQSLTPDTTGMQFFGRRESERQASFFVLGGLVGAHARGRSRDAVWDALERKETYGTSGPRIQLWFDLVNESTGRRPMGSEVAMRESPVFEVRAVGSFVQKPGCPEDSVSALPAERLARLCRGECYHPSDERRPIARIEVVRIRPRIHEGEEVTHLIEDPWRVYACPTDPVGCSVRFRDDEFAAAERDTSYYVRAIEQASPAVNADNLRCEFDEAGRCIATRPCPGLPADDECLGESEQRAWSSPVFVDFDGEPAG